MKLLKKEDYLEFIPLGFLLSSLIVFTIWDLMQGFSLKPLFYFVFFSTLISTILFFKARRVYRYIFFVILILGIVNLLPFTGTSFQSEFSFNELRVQGFPLFLFLLFLWVNAKNISSVFYRVIKFIKNTNEGSLVETFKNKFSSLSNEEIEEKLQEDLVPDAKKALEEILESRKIVL